MRSDRMIIEAVLAGDKEAFAEIVDRYKNPLFRYLLSIGVQMEEAKDLAQDTFLKLFLTLESFGFRSSLYTYLCRLGRNLHIDQIRRKRRESKVIGQWVDSQQPKMPRNRVTIEALARLPPDQRVAIDFFYIQGYKQREISELLGIPIGTVKSRIDRGLKRLKVILNEGT